VPECLKRRCVSGSHPLLRGGCILPLSGVLTAVRLVPAHPLKHEQRLPQHPLISADLGPQQAACGCAACAFVTAIGVSAANPAPRMMVRLDVESAAAGCQHAGNIASLTTTASPLYDPRMGRTPWTTSSAKAQVGMHAAACLQNMPPPHVV